MKFTTFLLAFGPAILILGLKFFIEPTWLNDWSVWDCLLMGIITGVSGGVAARIIQPKT
jgi:hypothetical protein